MAISEVVNSRYHQTVWELREWIKRGILWNECPSFVENLTVFKGGPWDGKKRMIPHHVPYWIVEKDYEPPTKAYQNGTAPANPSNVPRYEYVRKGPRLMECDK